MTSTIVRYPYQRIDEMVLNIFPLSVLATADVLSASYPLDTITVNNESVNWVSGLGNDRLVRIYDSTETVLKYEGTLRQEIILGSLRIARMQDGDTGIAKETAQTIVTGDKVKVYTVFAPKSFMSYLDGSNIFYKRSTFAYDPTWLSQDQQTRYGIPQPNMGKHQHGRVDPVTGKATFTMSAANSWDFSAGTLSYLWNLPSGVSFVAPSVATDATVTVEADAGEWIIRCNVTNGTTGFNRVGKRYLFATDDTSPAFSDIASITAVTSDVQDREGRTMSFTVTVPRGTDLSAYLYTGAPTLLTYDHLFSNDNWATTSTVADDFLVNNFYGYLRSFEQVATDADGVDTYTLRIESPLKYYSGLPIATQSVVAKSTPAQWNEIHTSLANIAYFVFYLMQFHAPILTELHDFDIDDLDAFERKWFETKGGDLFTALKKATAFCVGANIGCTSDGSMRLRRHGSFEDDTWRNANATQWTWQDSDIVERLEYQRDLIMRFGQTKGGAFVSAVTNNPTAVSAIAGVLAQQQGIGQQSMEGFIGFSSNDIRDRVGHYHTWSNRPTQSVSFETTVDIADPALMQWHDMAVTGYDPLDTGILEGDYRTLPLAVSRQWDIGESTTKRVNVTLEPETKGARAPLEPTAIVDVVFNPTWRYEFDFTVGELDWTFFVSPGGNTAVYSASNGWSTVDIRPNTPTGSYFRFASIYRLFPSRTLTSVEMQYNLTKGTYESEPALVFSRGVTGDWNAGIIGTRFYSLDSTALSNGTALTQTWSGNIVTSGISVRLASSQRTTATYTGSVLITRVRITGKGANPFGADNY